MIYEKKQGRPVRCKIFENVFFPISMNKLSLNIIIPSHSVMDYAENFIVHAIAKDQ